MNTINKIPEIIHYCWFGDDEMPEDAKKCVSSWKRICPTFKIIEWNEKNYDITKNKYVKQAYEQKKWSFVTDYVRLDVIYKYGGIYLDVDVELIKNISDLLAYDAFFGFESIKYVATGLGFGAIPQHEIVKKMLDMYNDLEFVLEDGSLNQITCPVYNTEIIQKSGFIINGETQIKSNVCVLSPEYLAPYNYSSAELNVTDKTYSIHWYNMSWKSIEEKKQVHKIQKVYKYSRLLGMIYEYGYYFWKFAKEKGILFTANKFINKVKKNEN